MLHVHLRVHAPAPCSKTYCPFSIEVKKTFEALNVPYAVLEMNTAKDGAEVFKSLKETTKHQTAPNVFIKVWTIVSHCVHTTFVVPMQASPHVRFTFFVFDSDSD